MSLAIKSVVAAALAGLLPWTALAQTAPALPAAMPAVGRSFMLDPPMDEPSAPRDPSPSVLVKAAVSRSASPVAVPAIKSAEPLGGQAPSAPSQSFNPAPYVYADGARSVVLGRYATSPARPPDDLIEPIESVVAITFPRQSVRTIREAVNFTLERSGYRFDDSAAGDAGDAAGQFLALPLPESQRQLGPYPLYSILGVLMGSAWQPVVNRVNRTVSIQLQVNYALARKPATAVAPAAPAAPSSGAAPAASGVAGIAPLPPAAARNVAAAGQAVPAMATPLASAGNRPSNRSQP